VSWADVIGVAGVVFDLVVLVWVVVALWKEHHEIFGKHL
jgi:hypothetical protein